MTSIKPVGLKLAQKQEQVLIRLLEDFESRTIACRVVRLNCVQPVQISFRFPPRSGLSTMDSGLAIFERA